MKTKETNPTRPGFRTPCKQALSHFERLRVRMGHYCVARYYGTVVIKIAVTKLRRKLGQCCAKLHYESMGLSWEYYRFFYWLFMRARLGQCCVKLHYGTVLGTLSLLFKFMFEFNNTLSC